ncbi:MAG: hypothetical protein KKD63_12750 [Proteobacteria bacterium]|nr:hypothetical protein [Desulfobulbaceae bacterium]MBU4153738.1 hypothetical protein [Pseudomonadota bacterium]MDP2105132.1 hypothetical protein [Desulfobulbaceae bacterium]
MAETDCIKPPGDKIRQALQWLGEAMQNRPETKRRQLLEEAEIRFNLSPRECEFLNCNFGETAQEGVTEPDR